MPFAGSVFSASRTRDTPGKATFVPLHSPRRAAGFREPKRHRLIKRLAFSLRGAYRPGAFPTESAGTFIFSCDLWARGSPCPSPCHYAPSAETAPGRRVPTVCLQTGVRGAERKSRMKDADRLLRDRVWELVTFPHSKPGSGPSRGGVSQELLAQERVAAEAGRPHRASWRFDSEGHRWGTNH